MRWSAAVALCVSSVVICLPTPAWAAKGGALDPSFGGVATAPFTNPTHAAALAIQDDGRIVTAGYAGPSGDGAFALARFTAGGALDPSFGVGGQVTTKVGIDVGAALVIQPDARIVVAGTSYTAPTGGIGRVMLLRYEASGALDATFGTSGVVITLPVSDAEVTAMARQPDGRLVVIGRDASGFMVRRYEADGSVDTGFGSGGGVTTPIGSTSAIARAVVIEPGGRIVVAGSTTTGPGNEDFALARYESDGSLDATFGSGGIVTTALGSLADAALALVRDSSGRVVAAGYTQVSSTGIDVRFALVRYDGSGALDPGFGSGGIVVDSSAVALASGLALQPDGKLVAVGAAAVDFGFVVQTLARVSRYDASGGHDTPFGFNGGVTSQWDDYSGAAAVALQADGRIVVAGHLAGSSSVYPFSPVNARFAVARYLAGTCGDGVQEIGEGCDDGNVAPGDCCDATCDLDLAGTACDDGQSDLCTGPDTCDGAGGCVSGGPIVCPPCEACDPMNGCVANVRPACKSPVQAGAARLKLTNVTSAVNDRMQWKWSAGAATTIGDFGAPETSDDLTLCVFDAASELAMSAAVPAGGLCASKPCWKPIANGFRYQDRYATPDGVTKAVLKAGTAGKAKVSVDGKGANLLLPNLATLNLPLRVQLQSENGQCWEATYSSGGVSQSDGEHFKARSD